MIFTQRQLEAMHIGNGRLVLPYRARLTPLAHDWVKRKGITIGYADVQTNLSPTIGSSSPLPAESPSAAAKFIWWCDGPCGPAKAAITGLSREANLKEMSAPADTRQTANAVKELAGAIKSGLADGGILLVKHAPVAIVLANRCPSLRAVLGTSLESLEQGIQQIAANVLIIEHPRATLMQARNLMLRFLRANRSLDDEMKKLLGEVASCG